MTGPTYDRTYALAKYRVSMKRALGKIGCQFDNTETTAELEKLIEINKLEV